MPQFAPRRYPTLPARFGTAKATISLVFLGKSKIAGS
jgi:hypothetical protein